MTKQVSFSLTFLSNIVHCGLSDTGEHWYHQHLLRCSTQTGTDRIPIVLGQTLLWQPPACHTVSVHAQSTPQEEKGLAALLVKAKEIARVQNDFPVTTQEICSEMEGMTGDLWPRLTLGTARGHPFSSGGKAHAHASEIWIPSELNAFPWHNPSATCCNWPKRWIKSELFLSTCIGFHFS